MANQTITSDSSIAAVEAGLNDGQNITINSGAVLTVDQSPTKLIGQVTINAGEMFLDGANAVDPIVFVGEAGEEINVNGAGVLRSSLGWWDFPATSDGTANQTFDCSNYFISSPINADVFSGVWVETGRRINYDNGSGVAPLVGDWVFAVSDNDIHGRITEVVGDEISGYMVVRFLTGALNDNDAIELHTLQDNDGPDYQKSWNGQVVGADVLEPGVFQEFGNARQNGINGLPTLGSGMAGFGFDQTYQSNTLAFGDGTNGFIPPDGARIRVPMVHFATSTLAAYPSGNTTWENATTRYELETIQGGDCFLSGVSMGSAYFEDNLGGTFQASYCAGNTGFGVFAAIARVTYDHCVFTSDLVTGVRSAARSNPPIVDLVSGADLRDCLMLSLYNSGETTQLGGQTSSNINIERCIQLSATSSEEAEFLRIGGITIYDFVVLGTQLVFSTSRNADVRLLKTQRNLDGSINNSDQVAVLGNSDNITITGWEILQNSSPNDSKIVVTDSSNVSVRCFHFIDDKFYNEKDGLLGEEFLSVTGFSSNITISRCWQDGGSPNEFALIAAGTSSNIVLQNCSGEYSGEIEPDGINTTIRGVHGGSGNLGTTTGLETDLSGTAGSNTGDLFESDTQGYFYCNMVPGSSDRPIDIVSGNPSFTKDGDVDVNAGDQFIIEMPYFAKGHTSFRNAAATLGRSGAQPADGTDTWGPDVMLEMQFDTGSGYNGTWLDVRDISTRTDITDMVDGIRLKYRITGLGFRDNLQAFVIYTNTSLADQAANLYPIDQVEFTLTNIISGSRVMLRANETVGSYVAGDVIFNGVATTDPFVFTLNYEGDMEVLYRVRNASTPPFYQPVEGLAILTASGFTGSVSQVLDE